MSRTKALARRMAARRDRREFERVLNNAPTTMAQELRAIALRNNVGGL